MVHLVIVESAAKAKTIEKYLNELPELGGKFKVMASMGHVRDMPLKGEKGYNPDTWDITYELLASKAKTVKLLKDAVKDVLKEKSKVYLAADPDLEGEAIANHLHTVLSLSKHVAANVCRVTFNEITKTALKAAMLAPRTIDMRRVDAQETRRVLDRIVGFEISPLLWRRFTEKGLSAGRVQSCALHMVNERYDNVLTHTYDPIWKVKGRFLLCCDDEEVGGGGQEPLSLVAKLAKHVEDQDSIKNLTANLEKTFTSDRSWEADFEAKQSSRNPAAPYSTSTLQQDAYRLMKTNAKATMRLAQDLYEAGWITYMRTDSVSICEHFQAQVVEYVTKTYGAAFVETRQYKTKALNAQEAHEAIRPTDVYRMFTGGVDDEDREALPDKISQQHVRLYSLIWRRTVASQMTAAMYKDIHYTMRLIRPQPNDPVFVGKESVLVYEGWLRVCGKDEEKEDKKDYLSPSWHRILNEDTGQAKNVPVNAVMFDTQFDVIRPTPLFTEPMLIQKLEHSGIGRPSTYASIIDKLFDKKYVGTGDVPEKKIKGYNYSVNQDGCAVVEAEVNVGGKEKDRLLTTGLGARVLKYLTETTPYLLDVKFTAELEDCLDNISTGNTDKKTTLTEFYDKISTSVGVAKEIAGTHRGKGDKDATGQSGGGAKGPAAIKTYNIDGLQVDLVNTRYGVALYQKVAKRFIGLVPYLDWKNKELADLNNDDISFLLSFPKPMNNSTKGHQLVYGPYGFYIKDAQDKNIAIKEHMWDAALNGELTDTIVDSMIKKPWSAKNTKHGSLKSTGLGKTKTKTQEQKEVQVVKQVQAQVQVQELAPKKKKVVVLRKIAELP